MTRLMLVKGFIQKNEDEEVTWRWVTPVSVSWTCARVAFLNDNHKRYREVRMGVWKRVRQERFRIDYLDFDLIVVDRDVQILALNTRQIWGKQGNEKR